MKKIFRNINVKVLIRALAVISLLLAVSMLFAFARAEGADGNVFLIMSIPAMIGSFPFLFFVEKLLPQIGSPYFFIAFAFDGLFYAFLFERVYTFFKRKKKIEV